MVILAVETATRRGSLALWIDGTCWPFETAGTRTHVERLPTDAMALLGRHGLRLQDVDLFAVVAGPGSSTGIRVGAAAVQGWALVAGRKVAAVSTLSALADSWIAGAGLETETTVVARLDGPHGEMFFAAWRTSGAWAEESPVVIPPQSGRLEDFERARAMLPAAASVVVVDPGMSRVSLAESAARAAARHPELATSPHGLIPQYLRRSSAEVARDRARAASGPPLAVITTRLFPQDDLSGIEALQNSAFTNAWGAEAIRWELANTEVARLYAMREPGGPLVAYCACWMVFDELHINSLAVDPAKRRRGLARRLLIDVFRDAVAAGARSATLEVRQSNQAARALYEGLGFTVEAVRRDYYQEPREDALILWHRRIGEHLAAPARLW